MSGPVRPVVRTAIAVAVTAVALSLAGAFAVSSAGAQDTPDTSGPAVSIPRIIPLPNSGHAPRDATDRGGWGQYAVLGGMVVALTVITLLVMRESRQAKRRSSTRNEPVSDTSTKSPESSARQ